MTYFVAQGKFHGKRHRDRHSQSISKRLLKLPKSLIYTALINHLNICFINQAYFADMK